ncbi:hypothetical protein R6Q57_021437 [Mikania cordata]
MDEAEPDIQRIMVTKSSIKRKPLADLTNIVRKSNNTSSFSQSKKHGSSAASDSSIGSTTNPINLHRPVIVPPDQLLPSKTRRFKPDHLVGEVNQTRQSQRHNPQNTRCITRAVVSLTSFQEGRNNGKEGSVSICSSTLDKIKDLGKVNQSCLDKMITDGKKISSDPCYPLTDKIKDTRKLFEAPLSVHHNANNSTNTHISHSTEMFKDKRNGNVVQSGHSHTQNANSDIIIAKPDSLAKRKDKGKAIADPLDYPSGKKFKNTMTEFGDPLKGVTIKEIEDMLTGSSIVNLAPKDKGKRVSTPINYHTMEKKDQQSSCPPILRTISNRNFADETEIVLQSKLQTEPPPNKKKKRCLGKEVNEKYTLPQDFVEQQRAYFKEIDDFELQVEEV